jgi:membrane protease YdiL (CAAX protease family)
MLFYAKKYLWLDLVVTVLLGGIGYWGVTSLAIPVPFALTPLSVLQGFAGFLVITLWTFAVQKGYAIVKGNAYAEAITTSLAKEYFSTSWMHAVAGGLTAALGEELFFRAFIQGQWGVIAGSVAFGILHVGGKDIRVVSYWSYVHGLLFGLSYSLTENFVVPVITHGLFDLGGVLYFQMLRDKNLGKEAMVKPVSA